MSLNSVETWLALSVGCVERELMFLKVVDEKRGCGWVHELNQSALMSFRASLTTRVIEDLSTDDATRDFGLRIIRSCYSFQYRRERDG